MIIILPEKIGDQGVFGKLADDAIHHIKHAFFRLLSLNDTSPKLSKGETLLHHAVKFLEELYIYSAEVLEMVLSIIRIIIRYGCQMDARNDDGFTAKDLALNYIKEVNPYYDDSDDSEPVIYTGYESTNPRIIKFLDALSGPSSVLPLEELAARVVLKWKIPYRDCLPEKLHEIVTGI